ncbi:transcriptional regulator, TetR family [Hoeflea sp. IMCC20628]|uniref:TetR/AcrR family transcriptional regulator n=1 Tax=Hoeflea sp. IMCC20628 TaxID=1620421 RepID=UPI00063AEAA9|nr:TetR/AcrR family transcriptional regulator [Hoeflea sp. IMCC20628]AKI01233.1 transcriptional regulator, TetR family [Hoeflea sp. IMCC20628]
MRDENRASRQETIEEAAYAVLEARGYAGASMLSIARAARASNETLYNWYGDKNGLFRALVLRNAEQVKALLEDGLRSDRNPLDVLRALGPRLLALLVSPRAIQLNRAAAADPTGELGAAISERGRETVGPLIGEVLERARREGALAFNVTGEAVELYLNLLVGDLQIRRAIGGVLPLDETTISRRAELAFGQFLRLNPASTSTTPLCHEQDHKG